MTLRRKADRVLKPFSVTTDDGTVFRCALSSLGRESEPRWVLIDANGQQYIGPLAEQDKSPAAVRQLVNDWWEQKKGA
jgi:hypothetical protein